MSDSQKLAHTIQLIIQNYGCVHIGDLKEAIPTGRAADAIHLVIMAFSNPVTLPELTPPVLNWFITATEIPIIVIADQPLPKEKMKRPIQYLKYPFDAQTLCDSVIDLLGSSQVH